MQACDFPRLCLKRKTWILNTLTSNDNHGQSPTNQVNKYTRTPSRLDHDGQKRRRSPHPGFSAETRPACRTTRHYPNAIKVGLVNFTLPSVSRLFWFHFPFLRCVSKRCTCQWEFYPKQQRSVRPSPIWRNMIENCNHREIQKCQNLLWSSMVYWSGQSS